MPSPPLPPTPNMASRTHPSRIERTRKAERGRQQMLTLMTIAPRSVAELSTRTGCSESFVRNELTAFKEQGLCHVHEYIERNVGGFTATFTAGQGKDAKLPKAADRAQEEKRRLDALNSKDQEAHAAALWQQVATKVTCYGIWGLA